MSSDAERAFLFYWRALAPDSAEPECEWPFHPERHWRFDFAWPSDHHKVAVEMDGGVWVQGRHQRALGFTGDLEKQNAAVALGWRVLRFTPQMLEKNPDDCIALVVRVLEPGRRR